MTEENSWKLYSGINLLLAFIVLFTSDNINLAGLFLIMNLLGLILARLSK